MARTLILTRHAKSSWDDPMLPDHDRPLNGRGQRSARAIGTWMRDRGWLPDQAISSTSRRTRETFAGLALDLDASFTGDLYHASAGEMFETLRGAGGERVLMLGHNPGIGWFAERLLAVPPDHPRFADYPTCATLVARFPIQDWADLAWGTGKALDFVIPRDLPAA
ncbi:SixA phosphatase family protein [Pukyongiella litopenaei]|uniref:Histidine phosphatase family protein n=1 Tax=Pukyongiella litopenaei TaxID=2605946 RepID=A0A2S0MQD5_9RHOB|nr:histidine phosphatase family protein [Pukyongiella litopenaei]AVO38099.1 histidine phosphatase family protein [Pukyongiella litopenaei]